MVAERLAEVRARIGVAAARVGRDSAEVTLLVVSKGHSDDDVRDAYEAGQREFGENRAAGLAGRLGLGLPDDIRWHFVGSLQRRKIKQVAPNIVLLHSLDRWSLVRAWAALEEAPPALLQVNVGREPQKHGIDPDDVLEVADAAVDLGIDLSGLMTIPPRPAAPEDSRPWFEMLADLGGRLRRRHPNAGELSMGMTDDYQVGVEAGATIVRVGRAIFEPAPTGGTGPTDAPR